MDGTCETKHLKKTNRLMLANGFVYLTTGVRFLSDDPQTDPWDMLLKKKKN